MDRLKREADPGEPAAHPTRDDLGVRLPAPAYRSIKLSYWLLILIAGAAGWAAIWLLF